MGKPLEAIQAAQQHFPAPNTSIRPITGAIERQPNHRPHEPVLGHAPGHMGVMVLHGDHPRSMLARPFPGPLGRQVPRMQIMHHSLRLNLEGAHQVAERLLEELQAGQVLQVSQMLALVNPPPPRQREDILQVPAHGQERRRVKFERGRQLHIQWEAQRHKSARTPNQLRSPIHHRGHRVVTPLQNLAIVHQKSIRNFTQPSQSLAVVDCNGFLAQVCRGHHQRLNSLVGKEQMLQRRIRQKHAQPRNPWRNRLGNPAASSLSSQHNRPRRCRQQRLFRRRQRAHRPRSLHIPHHHRQRLAIAVLTLPQTHHGRLIGCIHAQVEAANPLDGHNLSSQQPANGCSHGILSRNLLPAGPHQPDTRATLPARVRLRMEPPIRGIVVFRLAGRAHGEPRHRGLRPVIRNAPRDCESRAAVGAVQKWIPVAAVLWVKQFPQAIRAGRRIRRNSGAHTA